jgi:glycosyltransferase involved in cell wall biosynthesis
VLNEGMPIASILPEVEPSALAAKPSARRALLFFLSNQASYRSPLFSTEEIFCGPDATAAVHGGKVRALKTTVGSHDVRATLAQLPPEQQPEFIVVKADATHRNYPRNLSAVRGPKVLLVGDTHHLGRPIQSLIRYAQEEPFDFVIFDHTRHHARFFAEAGIRHLHWLPALDYGFEPRELRPAPSRPLTFVGQVGRFHPYRRWVLKQLLAAKLPLEVLQGRLAETADLYADSQVTLNISLNGDLNLRVFEALAAGGFLLTDELAPDSGLARLFEPGRHLETWRTPGELTEKIRHYLAHPAEARRIREAGRAELFRHHHPAVKLKEFYRLLDGGGPNPRYDLQGEPGWPRPAAVPSPGLPREIAAYESLQEVHKVSRQVTLFAADPAALSRLANLPRLQLAAIDELALQPAASEGEPAISQVIWWERATPAGILARFSGAMLLAVDELAAARPEAAEWGFAPEETGSPVLRLRHPALYLQRAWEAGAREAVRARLAPSLASARDAGTCVTLASYAQQLGAPDLQQAALLRAIALDRDNRTALLSLAVLQLERGDRAAAWILLEESARLAPLPEPIEVLRQDLCRKLDPAAKLAPYWRAIGRVPAPRAPQARRILLVTNIFPPQELGGYGRMMWEFAHGLRERGHDVRVLAGDLPALAKAPTPDEAALEPWVSRSLPLLGEWRGGQPVQVSGRAELAARMRGIAVAIATALQEFRPDVMLAGNVDFLEAIPIRVALGAGVPVLHALGNQTTGYSRATQPRSPRYCLAPSSDWNGEAVRTAGYKPARIETLYPGARIDRFFRFFLPAADRLRLCFAGLVLPYKGPHILVDALARLQRAGLDFTAEIAGDAPDPDFRDRLQAATRATGIADRVSFTGFLDRAALAALFARCNVLVFPSLVPETFGISQVEAMAAGLVVVSSGTGGAREIIRPGVDGLLFQGESAGDLAEKLCSLARDPALFSRLQHAAQSRAAAFSVEHSVSKIERLVEEMLLVPPDSNPSHAGNA